MWKQIAEARHRIARENGTIFKDWGGRVPIALVYPNTYHVGMSNLGFQTIYALLNSYDTVVCERAFWAGQDLHGAGEQIVSIESQRSLDEFAALAFSMTFELDYFNLVAILRQAKIPLFASQRDERHPLLIAGGPCISANPEPVAPFFDVLAIGEGEAIVGSLTDVLRQGIHDDRGNLLEAMAQLPGIYVPSLYQTARNVEGSTRSIAVPSNPPACPATVERQWVTDLDTYPVHSEVLTDDTELGSMYLIEVSRGCARGCQFCLAGFTFLPARERSFENVLEQARVGLGHRSTIGLVGAATTDYSQIGPLATRLRELGARVAVSSLRMDSLTEELLRALLDGGTKTITLAPEAGSERLRRVINKRLSEEQILQTADQLAKWKTRRLKLYYMVGLPTETEEDVGDIARLTLDIKRRLDADGKSQVTLNISPFVPKAQTPFQHESMMEAHVLDSRIKRIQKELRRPGIAVRSESPEWSEVQAVLAKGDRRLAGVLAAMEKTTLVSWRKALEQTGLSADYYIRRRPAPGETVPWAFVRSGVRPDHVAKRAAAACLG
ncbi:MAG: radical SAM protein [Chloroflexi bacterium]|nr:radical SAM protein [Chloroflexota bacterium]